MPEVGEGESGYDDRETDQRGCFCEHSEARQDADNGGDFEVPTLLDGPNTKGKYPGDNGIEERIVGDCRMEGDIHGKECGEGGGGEGDFLALQAPNTSEIDSEKGGNADECVEESQAESGGGVGGVGACNG